MPDNSRASVVNDGQSRERLNVVLNQLLDRAALIGSMSEGVRDLDKDCWYPKGFVPRELYQELYDREPVAARVVEVYPKECWQVQPTVYEDEDPEKETPFEEAWNDLSLSIRSETSYHQDTQGSALWEYVSRVDCLSGIGHYGIILLGIDDGKDLSEPADLIAGALPAGVAISSGGGPWTPIPGTPEAGTVGEGNGNGKNGKAPKTVPSAQYTEPKGFQGGKRRIWSWNASGTNGKTRSATRKLTFMRVFPESMAWVNLFDSDPKSPRFGQPTEYTIYFNDPTTQSAGIGAQMITAPVHWTRVIHIADNLGSSEVFGVPRMQQVLNRLLDLRKLYGGSAEMYWRGAFPGYSLETLPQFGTDVEIDENKVKQMMWDWANGLQRYITLTGLTIKGISPQVSDPTNQVNTHIEAICVKLGVPVRIFKGSERGELASSQDDDAWNDRLRQRQNNYITPRIIVPLVDRLISLGVLPQPEGYSVWWPDLAGKTDTEKATVGGQRTTAIVAYAAQPAALDLITPMDYWTRIQGLTDEEAQTIVENAEEAKAQRQKEAEAQQAQQAKDAEIAHQRQLELVKAQTPEQPPPGFGPDGEQGGDSPGSVGGPGAAAGQAPVGQPAPEQNQAPVVVNVYPPEPPATAEPVTVHETVPLLPPIPTTAPLEHSRLGLLPTVPPPVFTWPHIDISPQEVQPLGNFDPDQPRDDTGKWSAAGSHEPGVPDSRSTEAFKQHLTRPEKAGPQDEYLHDLAHENGFAAKPRVVSKDELDKLIADGATELYRGSSAEYDHQMREGEYFAARGSYGVGYYTGIGPQAAQTARSYTGYSGKGGGSVISRMALDKGARVADYDKLEIELEDAVEKYKSTQAVPASTGLKDKIMGQIKEALAVGDQAKVDDLFNQYRAAKSTTPRDKQLLYGSVGRYAMNQGYDAIHVKGMQYLVVLNRSKLYIQDDHV